MPEPRQIPLPLRLDDEATLANFHASSANAALLRHLEQAIGEAGPASGDGSGTLVRHFYWLYGEEGAGRTHILQALCHEAQRRELMPVYLPLAEHGQWRPEILEGLETLDVVCLDDVDCIAGNREWEAALFHLYNRLAQSGARLCMAASASPRHSRMQLGDLLSRLQSAAVFQLRPLDDEGKMRALQLRARSRGMELSDEVTSYLITRGHRGMKPLLETLSRLDEYSLAHKRRITVPLVRSLMGW